MRRRRTCAGLAALAVVAFWVPAVSASEYDGRYAGQITCDILPGQTVQPLKTEFSMKVTDGRAEYQREVLRPNSSGRLGVTEHGTGAVSPSGEVTLTGSAAGQTWSYDATYQGRFDKAGLRLAGTQRWQLPNRPAHARSCTIGLSRSD